MRLSGLVEIDETGEPEIDKKTGKPKMIDPKDSDRVFVDVTAYNSKNYYILGDVLITGKLPITGNETVLDAINFAGGLMPTAAPQNIRLVRPAPPGCLLRTGPAGQPGRDHQRRRSDDQLSAHAQ